jgi:hypothetical protein
MYKHGTLKPVKTILRSRWRKRENNGREEPSLGTIYIYIYILACHNETPV